MFNHFRLAPLHGARTIKYQVSFEVSASIRRLCEPKTVTVEVNDTGDDRTNHSDALVTATLELDDAGIKHWTLKGCTKATS